MRSIELVQFLNDRETPMPIPIGTWMFQTKLYIDAGERRFSSGATCRAQIAGT